MIALLFASCKTSTESELRHVDLGSFTIEIPKIWKTDIPDDQEDSFVGRIIGPKLILSFDCSDMGYASDLKDIDTSSHHIQIDSTNKYIIKTIYPKKAGKGMTGIYLKSRSSSFDFQMNGVDLSVENEQRALKAFKTITFKK